MSASRRDLAHLLDGSTRRESDHLGLAIGERGGGAQRGSKERQEKDETKEAGSRGLVFH